MDPFDHNVMYTQKITELHSDRSLLYSVVHSHHGASSEATADASIRNSNVGGS